MAIAPNKLERQMLELGYDLDDLHYWTKQEMQEMVKEGIN